MEAVYGNTFCVIRMVSFEFYLHKSVNNHQTLVSHKDKINHKTLTSRMKNAVSEDVNIRVKRQFQELIKR